MKRMLIGATLGASAMYLLDPANGKSRRRRVSHFWDKNKDDVLDGARTASEQVQVASRQAATVASKVTAAVGDRVEQATGGDSGAAGRH